MAVVDRTLIMHPRLRASVLAHQARSHYIPPKPATPSDYHERPSPGRVVVSEAGKVPARGLVTLVSEVTGIPIMEMKSRSRRQPLVRARHIAAWLMRVFTDLSWSQIAQRLGGRDHTCPLRGVERIDRLIASKGLKIPEEPHAMAALIWEAWAR